jgi:hypothetical protein
LRYPGFRWLLSGLAVSQTGDWLYILALVVLVYQRTHSALWVGVTTAFPAAIAGIVVGSVIAPGLAALLGASTALIAVGGTALGYALLVIRGADDAAVGPASQPAMADAVPAR